ncbi:Mur ligase family protein [Bifidobacterium vespertilionis]|uniref:Lipid II isoglutaminyl synthase (glutamine-hydrolyzing) subunit MurT n=1 Tax=Bifidobacterium vespertilionis TaxID=2562524 RepID=A0A5J5DVS9_9BIFI|nr:Mur ligase family protein [Bifidobacterium vespertilionis]KAA8820975.1 Mur ligase family protein [Bifidobacterium vespertilionis]KAA8822797.1 Mur ligase family protein [Bifidobacterium vespertilionis]
MASSASGSDSKQSAESSQSADSKQSIETAVFRTPWYAFATPAIGRAVRTLSRLTHHGGSALPGRVVERIDPGFLSRTLSRLPYGVVLVSGTNGKTTTTRMVASMLSELGFRVFTNPTGSNFTRGVVSALLTQVHGVNGLDADIAVLELDEAYAVHFVRQIRPRYALLLNVMRDQLDRFGEIDNTARLLGHVAAATTGTVVLNREDPRISALATLAPKNTCVRYFGLSDDLKSAFPSDDDMATTVAVESEPQPAEQPKEPQPVPAIPSEPSHAPLVSAAHPPLQADVALTRVGDHEADFLMDGRNLTTKVRLEGVYNLYNAAAALAVVRAVLRDSSRQASDDELLAAVSHVTPAFGRGEIIDVNGSPVELLLVKNPMGFRLSLASFPPAGADTMIVINDEYADGRDMSWLWDVDFTSLRETGVAMVSGVRAWDMALRLGYDQVAAPRVEPDIDAALNAFVAANPGATKHIYCTYTAMLHVRAALAKIAHVADVGVGR